jgi:thiamine biosynthesis lipoprotein
MGTAFELFLVGEDAEHLEAVSAAVEDEVRRLESALSVFDPAGEGYRVNRTAAERPVRVDVELWELLALCEQYRARTDGAFDITACSEVAALRVPDRLIFDPDNRTVRFATAGVRIDFGGIAKGYALDRAGALLQHFGITNALLNGGTSSLLACGDSPWPVDVRDPAAQDRPPVGRVMLVNQAFSCSAVRHPGQAVSDVRDPATGTPLAGRAACVVLAPSATTAEALSTALLGMGRERAIAYLERNPWPDARAAWVADGHLEWWE